MTMATGDTFPIDIRGIDNLTPTMRRAERQVNESAGRIERDAQRMDRGFSGWGRSIRNVTRMLGPLLGVSLSLNTVLRSNTAESKAFKSELDKLSESLSTALLPAMRPIINALVPLLEMLNRLPAPVLSTLTGAVIGATVGGPWGAAIGAGAGFGVGVAGRNPQTVVFNNARITSKAEAQVLAGEIVRGVK